MMEGDSSAGSGVERWIGDVARSSIRSIFDADRRSAAGDPHWLAQIAEEEEAMLQAVSPVRLRHREPPTLRWLLTVAVP